MCGRYYVDDETAREIEKLIRQVNEKLRRESMMPVHDRMPLIFERNEAAQWILNDEQLSLF